MRDSSIPVSEDTTGARIASETLPKFVQICVKAGVLLACVLGTLVAIALLVPDGNDYGSVSKLKHDRLARFETQKIVFVGGSNLGFGLDSPMIQLATGCPVVNMGINGYIGVRFMLEEVKPRLKPSDIVVIAFEWDNFYKTVDGSGLDLLGVVKDNPATLAYLTPQQKLRALTATMEVAQRKVMRMLTESISSLKNRLTGSAADSMTEQLRTLLAVETFKGFTPEGDLVSHLGVDWPWHREDGIIPEGRPIESEVITLMRDFTAEMAKRDVSVIVSYTPAIRYFYEKHRATIDEAHALITATQPLVAPSPPSAFVYDEKYFFDTVYHLNAEGRALRTRRVIEDIQSQLKERASCPEAAAEASLARSKERPTIDLP